MYSRRRFLETAALPLTIWPRQALGASFPATYPDGAVFPRPAHGATAGINPPGFAWWRAHGAASYRLSIQDRSGKTVYDSVNLRDPVHLPARTLPPGEYRWDVEALHHNGTVLARRGWWRFTVPEDLPELPWVEAKSLLARVPDSHPRYIFLKDDLPRIRLSLSGGRRDTWEQLRRVADKALEEPLLEPPKYHTLEGRTRQRAAFRVYRRNFGRLMAGALTPLSIAYLLSGEERYGLAAKKRLLEIESWGIGGPMSVMSPFGDGLGLHMACHGHRAYDWLYPLFDQSERERIRNMTAGRARQVLERLRKADYLASPGDSHNGRLIAYLSEYAVVLKEEAPDSAEWLDYSLRALTTFYPHWAGEDGGWAEGVNYALAYNTIYVPAVESLRAAASFDLYKRPFFRNVRKFFLYCASPVGEIRPFGDGAEHTIRGKGSVLLTHYGRRFQDPVCIWWARQNYEGAVGSLFSLMTEDEVKPAPPATHPSAAVFRSVGWAALHSALEDPGRDTFFLFKSSPFGSVSHSHADQNSFCILKGGRALAIASGHYGPAYSMPHHADWTRQTKANNCILVNGEGQVVRSSAAQGRITQFRHQKALTYVCGDAAAAYGGKLTRFLRHVLFLRPGVFLLLDEVEAPAPAEFAWLLHALEEMRVDPAAQAVTSGRHGASLTVRLACDAGLSFHQTDAFDTPYNEGNPPEYHEQKDNHWHFSARTMRRARQVRIAALMSVRDEREEFVAMAKEHPGWLGLAIENAAGTGEAWLQVTPGAKGPPIAEGSGALLAARWQPAAGEPEMMIV